VSKLQTSRRRSISFDESQKPGIRIGFLWSLIILLTFVVAALIWKHDRRNPSNWNGADPSHGDPMAETANSSNTSFKTGLVTVYKNGETSEPDLAQMNLASPLNNTNAATIERELKERISELESELKRAKAGIPNSASNALFTAKAGRWVSTEKYSKARPESLLTRRITISSTTEGLVVHAWEIGNREAGIEPRDWGEAPLIDLGTGMDPGNLQPGGYGLAMFAGGATQGGFVGEHTLYLIIRFNDSPTIWTAWGRTIMLSNYGSLFFERYMDPE